MYIYFNKQTGEAKMTSGRKIQTDNLGELEIAKKDIDFNKLNFEYTTEVKGNKLKHIKKPASQVEKQKKFQKELDKANSIDDIKQALKNYG